MIDGMVLSIALRAVSRAASSARADRVAHSLGVAVNAAIALAARPLSPDP